MDQPRDRGESQLKPDYPLFSEGIKTAASKLTGSLVVLGIAVITLGWVAVQLGESGWWAGSIMAIVMIGLLALTPLLLSKTGYAEDKRVDSQRPDPSTESEADS